MNNDNIIEEKLGKWCDKYGHFLSFESDAITDLRTALLEVEQAGYDRGYKRRENELIIMMDECEKKGWDFKRFITTFCALSTHLTPTDNNKEDNKPLETALAEATSN